jgi:hypothetical protein
MKYLEDLLAASYSDATEAKEALEQFFEPEDITISESGIYLHGLKLYEVYRNGFSASRGFANSLRRNNLVEVYNVCKEYGYLTLLGTFGWTNIANHKDDIKEKLILFREYKVKPKNIPKAWCVQYSPVRISRMLKDRYAGKARSNRPESKR